MLDVSWRLENAHLDRQHIVGIEAEIDFRDSSKACQEQPRSNEENDGERDLRDHEARAKHSRAKTCGARALGLIEHTDDDSIDNQSVDAIWTVVETARGHDVPLAPRLRHPVR